MTQPLLIRPVTNDDTAQLLRLAGALDTVN